MTALNLEPYAARLHWQFGQPLSGEAWGGLLAEHLDLLADRCRLAGSTVIGHIKGLALTPEGGFIRLNLVSAARPTAVECAAIGRYAALTVDLNVLVYGLPADQAAQWTWETAAAVAARHAGQVSGANIADHPAHAHE